MACNDDPGRSYVQCIHCLGPSTSAKTGAGSGKTVGTVKLLQTRKAFTANDKFADYADRILRKTIARELVRLYPLLHPVDFLDILRDMTEQDFVDAFSADRPPSLADQERLSSINETIQDVVSARNVESTTLESLRKRSKRKNSSTVNGEPRFSTSRPVKQTDSETVRSSASCSPPAVEPETDPNPPQALFPPEEPSEDDELGDLVIAEPEEPEETPIKTEPDEPVPSPDNFTDNYVIRQERCDAELILGADLSRLVELEHVPQKRRRRSRVRSKRQSEQRVYKMESVLVSCVL